MVGVVVDVSGQTFEKSARNDGIDLLCLATEKTNHIKRVRGLLMQLSCDFFFTLPPRADTRRVGIGIAARGRFNPLVHMNCRIFFEQLFHAESSPR